MKKQILGIAGALLASLPAFAGVDWYAVDPLSENKYMPDAAPKNGEKGGVVRIVAAKDEYEPGSFVLVADQDLGKVQLEVSDLKQVEGGRLKAEQRTDLKQAEGQRSEVKQRTDNHSTVQPPTSNLQPPAVFPKANIDLKNVKVWYQNGNAWISYFLDKKLYLCPELLLNDEDLVKVDTEKKWNYARLTEKDGRVWYRWLNPPGAVDTRLEDATGSINERYVGGSFACMKENFSDAPTFQGVTLKKGVHKQIFVTVHVTKDIPAGLYKGVVKVKGEGQGERSRSTEDGKQPLSTSTSTSTLCSIPISLRVLDFTLPKPGTYADWRKPFGTRFNQYLSLNYILAANGGDRALAEKQMEAILKNFVAHGDINPRYRDRDEHPEWGIAAGQDFGNEFYSAGDMILGEKVEIRYHARHLKEKMTKLCGWHRPYLTYNNEIGLRHLRAFRNTGVPKIYHDEGFRYALESKYGYESEAHLADLFWPPFTPDSPNFARTYKMGRLGAGSGWYANQHVGVENPAFNRRQYGFSAYRAGFTCDANYAHHLTGWNDIAGELYKQMMLVYGTGNGCVDTLAWEGVREGLDDIRYATKLQELATPHLNSENVEARYAAKRAMQLLADADGDDMDLTTLRLEMIEHIERLRRVGESVVRGEK